MLKLLTIVALFVFSFASVFADILSRCQLVYKLRNEKIPEDKLRDWVCLVEAETGRDTDWYSGPNDDGSHDYGLFRINDMAWCSKHVNGGECKATCGDLMGPDIAAAVKCAQKMYRRQGFAMWYGWRTNCRELESLPDITVC